MKSRSTTTFYLNGEKTEVAGIDNSLMLADYLRERRALTGTKIVCAEGDCGACTVLVTKKTRGKKTSAFQAINSCIARVPQLDGLSVVTVEGVTREEQSHCSVQKAVYDAHGSQCGFCTPGFIMALSELVDKRRCAGRSKLGEQEIKNALTGNLCRCTGYEAIIRGASAIDPTQAEDLEKRYGNPRILRELVGVRKKPLLIETEHFSLVAPVRALDVSTWLKKGYRPLSGGTDFGVQVNKFKTEDTRVLSLHLIERSDEIRVSANRVSIGVRVTFAELRRAIEKKFPEFASYLDIFASPQIKNTASIVGNVANGSPIGDSIPALMACDANVVIQNGARKRKLPLSSLYLGYRKLALKRGEWITGIEFQIPNKKTTVQFLKSSQRKDLDISAVNGALWIERGAGGKITQARLAVGGVGATVLRIGAVEKILRGAKLSASLRSQSVDALQKSITPLSDVRGTSAFRRVIVGNWLNETLKKIEFQGSEARS